MACGVNVNDVPAFRLSEIMASNRPGRPFPQRPISTPYGARGLTWPQGVLAPLNRSGVGLAGIRRRGLEQAGLARLEIGPNPGLGRVDRLLMRGRSISIVNIRRPRRRGAGLARRRVSKYFWIGRRGRIRRLLKVQNLPPFLP